MQLADLAKIALEYLDGSGRPFKQSRPKVPAATVAAPPPAAHHSSVPAPAAQPVVALDAAEVGAEPAPAAAAAPAAAPVAAAGGNPAADAIAIAIAIDEAAEENGDDGEDLEGVVEWDEDARFRRQRQRRRGRVDGPGAPPVT